MNFIRIIAPVSAAALMASTAAGATSPRFVLFEGQKHWLAIDLATRAIERTPYPGGRMPESSTISPDGAIIALIREKSDGSSELALLERASGELRSLTAAGSVRGDVAFSRDGSWLYFTKGRPLEHVAKQYAQVHRAKVDGSKVEPVTGTKGCHFAPAAGCGGDVFFVYSNCLGSRTLGRQSAKGEQLFDWTPAYVEAAVSPDCRRALTTVAGAGPIKVFESDLVGKKTTLMLETTAGRPHIRLQYGRSAKEFFFQTTGAVWVHEGGKTSMLAGFSEVER